MSAPAYRTPPPPQEQGKKPLWQRRTAAIPLYAAFLLGLLWAACAGFEAAPAERVVLTPPPLATATPAKPAPSATPDTGVGEPTPVKPAPGATPVAAGGEPAPAAAPGLGPTSYSDYSFVQLTAGERTFCGLRLDGEAVCWGNAGKNTKSAIGRVVWGKKFRRIAAGKVFFCGIQDHNGAISCAGAWRTPASPVGEFVAVDAGKSHACALDAAGAATCWGWDKNGRATAPEGIAFTAIDAGGTHSCGLDTQGALHCWGSNGQGQADAQPGPFQALALGVNNTCALRGDGTVFCQGDDLHGQSRPPDTTFVQISVGQEHGCGVREVGAVVCWGADWASKGLPPGRFVAVSAGFSQSLTLVVVIEDVV